MAEAACKRLGGGQVSRGKALLASAVVGIGVAVAAYKFLRSGAETASSSSA
ncbi:MAG TPA: hypothetical protein VFK62_01160 [Gaiellaceae bacterium]|nr:hypothetical protein [Gaiellaceae bacterium]